jgi:hypothetical protein
MDFWAGHSTAVQCCQACWVMIIFSHHGEESASFSECHELRLQKDTPAHAVLAETLQQFRRDKTFKLIYQFLRG